MFQAIAFLTLLNGFIYLFAPARIARLPVVGSSFVEAPHMLRDTFCRAIQLGFGVCGWLDLKHTEKFMSVLLFQSLRVWIVKGFLSGPLTVRELERRSSRSRNRTSRMNGSRQVRNSNKNNSYKGTCVQPS